MQVDPDEPPKPQLPTRGILEPGEALAADPPRSPLLRWRQRVIGGARDPLDPHIFHNLSLVAFLAWVGLGADGLSSSCYGPAEAFVALEHHTFLALILAAMTAVTVLVISASYSQIIELFPTGGGGYLVASHLLGPTAGLVSGCALVIDYVLTISVSIASGTDALFSLFPPGLQSWELPVAALAVAGLTLLNLRGVKESVTLLVPVFLIFLVTHVVLIVAALFQHAPDAGRIVQEAFDESQRATREIGGWALAVVLLRAYSLGGGTYTGIEAVSNGMQILREPKVQTARRTMRYMAISLAGTAGGLLLAYLLFEVRHDPNRTLNAVLAESVTAHWPGGWLFVGITLLSEAALLLVAAQTGFLDGPRVLANMAIDSWVPRRFYQLSDRLVTQNGIVLMGAAALAILLYTRGSVGTLVVLYSINVFLTFSLSQLGMCVHWWQVRATEPRWLRRLALNGLGLLITGSILCVTVSLKFLAGGWLTVVLTTGFVGACVWIRRHYDEVGSKLGRLDELVAAVPRTRGGKPPPARDPRAPTAVFLVTGYNGLGLHTVLNVPRLFGEHFKNFVFVSVGVIDSSRFKGTSEIEELRRSTQESLQKYVELMAGSGVHAEYWYALGPDAVDELEKLCVEIGKRFAHAIFFSGKLVFSQETFLNRVLHNQAAATLQRRLQFKGLPLVVLPVRVT